MGTEATTPPEGGGLFGLRKQQVAQIVAQHEVLQRQAEGRAQAAEARVVELQAELDQLHERLAAAQGELETTREKLSRTAAELSEADERRAMLEQNTPSASTAKFLNEELASVLTAAQQAAAQILDRARAQADGQLAEAKRAWADVEADRARFAAWREEAEPYIRAVQEKIEGVRGKIEEVPIRIRQALDMVLGAVAAMDTDLAQIMAVPGPPVLQEPSESSMALGETGGSDDVEVEVGETGTTGDRVRVIEGGGAAGNPDKAGQESA